VLQHDTIFFVQSSAVRGLRLWHVFKENCGANVWKQRYGKRAVNELKAVETYKKIVTNYACFRQTTMLTTKIIKETIENIFQFDLVNDES